MFLTNCVQCIVHWFKIYTYLSRSYIEVFGRMQMHDAKAQGRPGQCASRCIFWKKLQGFFRKLRSSTPYIKPGHGSYELIIMLEKCGRLNLTVFHLMSNRHLWQQKKIKILGAILEISVKQLCQSSPFTSKIGPNGLNGQCCLAGSSKTAPKILIFFNCHGCQTFILDEIHA